MASPRRRASTAVVETLFREPYRFDFFQAVRLLEWIFRERGRSSGQTPRAPVGRDAAPDEEIVRFRVASSFNFPASTIVDLKELPAAQADQSPPPPQMQVSFMGLTGPSGVMPEHYTDLLLRRIRLKDNALRDFLDIFNHRSISLFYRAWEKYRFPSAWERARLDPEAADLFTDCLRCLVGLGTAALNDRLRISDEVVFYYAGHMAHRPRSALALEALLSDYLRLPVQIQQFQGQWLDLSREEQTRLPGVECPAGQYHQLGNGAVVGERVWDVRSRFHLRVEHLRYSQFVRLLPEGEHFISVCQLTRTYAGPEFTFAVQPVLAVDEVPVCQLAQDGIYQPRLGWNTWLGEATLAKEIDAAVFVWRDLSGQ